MIPKRLKIQFLNGIDLIITDKCRKVSMFLDNAQNDETLRKSKRQSAGHSSHQSLFSNRSDVGADLAQPEEEYSILKLEQTTFELLRKLQNTYYIILRADKGNLQVNHNMNAISLTGFVQEIDFAMRKERSVLPVTKQSLVVHNKLSFEKVESNLTPSCLNYLIQIANVVKGMTFHSSIKQKIFAKMLSEEFLIENILAQKHT